MTRLCYDMSSYIKTGMLVGTDPDGERVVFEGKEIVVPSAAYGYERITNMMLRTMNDVALQPRDCLLVFEGMSSKSKRLVIDAAYKSGRDKRPPEVDRIFLVLERVGRDIGEVAPTRHALAVARHDLAREAAERQCRRGGERIVNSASKVQFHHALSSRTH